MRATLGFRVHTGWAVVVAVGGSPGSPRVVGKTRIDVASSFDEGAVFHVAQALPIEGASALVRAAEVRFTERARAALATFAERLSARIVAAGMAAPAAKPLPPLDAIVKSHARVHAAEGELYRRVFGEAAASLGARPARVPPEDLAPRAAAALGIAPAALAARLAEMGRESGKPWAADQKQAALAAWLALASVAD
jgi:hypothetical protein